MTENVIEQASPQNTTPVTPAGRGQASPSMQRRGRKRNWRGLLWLGLVIVAIIGFAGYMGASILAKGVFKQPTAQTEQNSAPRPKAVIGAPEVGSDNPAPEVSDFAKNQKAQESSQDNMPPAPGPSVPGMAPLMGGSTAGYPAGQSSQQTAPKSRFDSPLNTDAAANNAARLGGGMNPVSAISAAQQGIQMANGQQNGLGASLQPTSTPKAQASMIGNRNYVIPKGTTIDCVLNTAINSTVPGMTSCTLTRNIYSDNGKVLLLERGSVATGEFKADIKVGQSRIFVLWSRVKTPNGVVINLDSPGADSLGRSGFGGDIDNHWWERIGSAFMLSLVQDAIGYAATRGANNNNGASQMYFQNTQQAGNQMASKVLEGTINIPPTLTKNQGERVSIFVARDLDFTGVYGLTTQ